MPEPRLVRLMKSSNQRDAAHNVKAGRPPKYATDAERGAAVRRSNRKTALKKSLKTCLARLARIEAELKELDG